MSHHRVMRSFVSLWLLGAAGRGLADEHQPVRSTATVEVLDDKAQVDDVISKMKAQKSAAPSEVKSELRDLKQDRPPLPPPSQLPPSKRSTVDASKQHAAVWRAAHSERTGNAERTEGKHHRRK